ncbi:MAG: DUF2971 domain-containing protein [Thermoanaerobaculia bacterium]
MQQFLFDVTQSLVTHVMFKTWYVASFSAEGNLLSQWRAYCKAGGYSLGFDGSAINELFSGSGLFAFGKVIYNEEEQVASIRRVVDRSVDTWKRLRDKYPDVEQAEFDRQLLLQLAIALTERFIFIKTQAFAEEQEWRVAKYRVESDDLSFRERSGTLIPFLTTDLRSGGRLPLSAVYVSPLGEQELAHHAAVEALHAAKYQDADDIIRVAGYRLRF